MKEDRKSSGIEEMGVDLGGSRGAMGRGGGGEGHQSTWFEILNKFIRVLCFHRPPTSRLGLSRLILDAVTNMISEL